jgi:hypothetical protein
VLDLLKLCATSWMACYPVGAEVGNVRNQGAKLIEPVVDLFPA